MQASTKNEGVCLGNLKFVHGKPAMPELYTFSIL